MAEKNILIDNCNSQEAEYSDSFVGIHYLNGKFEIKYPLGFTPIKLNHNTIVSKSDEIQYKKDILKLISILHYYKTKDRTHREAKEILNNEETDNFPLYSYLYIYKWFRKYGYYKPKEIIYKKGKSGKINWNRTIKQIRPIINNNNIIYLDFVVRKETYNNDELIAEIFRFCVYESYKKIGCLFTTKMPKCQTFKIRNKLYIAALKNKIESTFNDEERELFINMKMILETESNKTSNYEYYYGTENFNNIWEKLIDEVYGIEKNRAEFLRPHIKWIIPNQKDKEFTLKPDTIMIPETENTKNKIYILDAKYYKAGVNLDEGSLPGGDSVIKQIVYAEKFKKNSKYKDYEIFNAFILPYDKKDGNFIIKLGETKEDWLEKEYDDPNFKYVRVQGIKMDTRQLMYNHKHASDIVFDELADLIEQGMK